MFVRLTWITALVISSLVFGSVAAFALIGPPVQGDRDADAPALYGP